MASFSARLRSDVAISAAVNPAPADVQHFAFGWQLDPGTFAARIAKGDRPLVMNGGGGHHMNQFRLVARRHHHHVGQAGKEPDVESPGMGRPVLTDKAGPVDGKANGKILQGHVMHDLVIAALEETGIYRTKGPHAAGGKACGKGHAMLLGNADIKDPGRQTALHDIKARPARHGGSDRDNAFDRDAMDQDRP